MTTQEFSDKFDVLINAFARNPETGSPQSIIFPEVNEYDKSVFLTKAQKEIVSGLYTGKYKDEAFEETEELRRDLDGLVVTVTPEEVTGQTGVSSSSQFFQLPDDIWWIIYEAVTLSSPIYCSGDALEVVPVRHDEFHRINKNPFKQANGRRALRLDCGNNIVEIVTAGTISQYLLRYLKKPSPIILVDLSNTDLSIDGETEITECELNSSLHQAILDRAVQLALTRMQTK